MKFISFWINEYLNLVDLGHRSSQDGPELCRPMSWTPAQFSNWKMDPEVWILWGEHLHCHPQGSLAVCHQVLVLREGFVQLWVSWQQFNWGCLWQLKSTILDYLKYLSYLQVGHYTQLVWSSSHKVGCGFSKCVGSKSSPWKKYYAYICNYCPQ